MVTPHPPTKKAKENWAYATRLTEGEHLRTSTTIARELQQNRDCQLKFRVSLNYVLSKLQQS